MNCACESVSQLIHNLIFCFVSLGVRTHACTHTHTFNFVMSNEAKGVKERLTAKMLGIKTKMHVMQYFAHLHEHASLSKPFR